MDRSLGAYKDETTSRCKTVNVYRDCPASETAQKSPHVAQVTHFIHLETTPFAPGEEIKPCPDNLSPVRSLRNILHTNGENISYVGIPSFSGCTKEIRETGGGRGGGISDGARFIHAISHILRFSVFHRRRLLLPSGWIRFRIR